MARIVAAIVGSLALALPGCAPTSPDPVSPSPNVSSSPGPNCAQDLAPRTSPIDVPAAVLYLDGDDLPPVLGEVRFEGPGPDREAGYTPRIDIHLERFTVLQTNTARQFSIRMTDGVDIAAWEVWAVPAEPFRAGDLESDRTTWSQGDEELALVCVDLREGEWLIGADIVFADALGEGTYYWRLNATDLPDA
ncbi:MAG: hypothetical protein ACRDGV_13205 [Candidatus Limnocylindria bacterium]